MIKIATWADTLTLPDNLNKFVQERFQFLYKVYAEEHTIPIEQFSLAEYGEICIVESYQEGSRRGAISVCRNLQPR